jgi:ABC-type antimicrobial peptide transport system permease subunit
LLASIGVFGVQSYAVTTRRRELGIRVALGARAAQIHRLVLRRAGSLAMVGGGVGLVASLVTGRALASQLHGVATPDVPSCAAAAVVMTAVIVMAAWLPARRAALMDPVAALRED